MNPLDKEINSLIMREVGLDVGPKSRIVDQDTGVGLKINGMDIVAPGCYGGKQSMEFDPYNNRKMMNQMFGYFSDKLDEEEDIGVMCTYNIDGPPNSDAGCIECRLSDNTIIRSGFYKKDTLKYADMIMRLNGDPNPDLSKYDVVEVAPEVKKKAPAKKVKKNVKVSADK